MTNKTTKGYYISKDNQAKLEKFGAALQVPHCRPSASLYLDILLTEHFAKLEKSTKKKQAITAPADALDYIPLKSGKYYVTKEFFNKCAEAYPSIDTAQEFSAMKAWCEANPSKRKTATGIKRFINAWLNRATTKGGSKIDMGGTDWANQGMDIL